MKNIFPFDRFWNKSGEIIPLDDFGFMRDPTSKWSHIYFSKAVLKTNQLISKKCLLLLGEPGIGKSTELKKLQDLEAEEKPHTVFFELRNYDSKDNLRQGIFNDESVKSWLKNSKKPISIYLDSLDEALLETKRISFGVFEIVKELNQHGEVFLRLACRTADLPSDFENQLKSIYEDSKLSLELTPLRCEDIRLAAKISNLDSEKFLAIVQDKELGVLASRPITLNMLLEEFQETHTVSDNISDTYEKGALFLLESPEHRIELNNDGELTPEQRLLIAEKIAASLMICNKSAILTGTLSSRESTDLHMDQIDSGSEIDLNSNDILNLSKSKINETLDTALFKSSGKNRYSLIHQTFAEYLTARYLRRNNFTKAMLYDIFVINDEVSEGLVPQLREVALWTSTLNKKFFRRLVDIDPELLLKSTLSGYDEKRNALIINSLLNHVSLGKLEARINYRNFKLYKHLTFPGLGKFLIKKLKRNKKEKNTKHFLLDIVSACTLHHVADDLIEVALSSKYETSIREHSLNVLSELNSAKKTNKIISLLSSKDEKIIKLQASSVKYLFPDFISIQEVIDLLSESEGLRDTIISISGRKILKQSTSNDLIKLLNWASSNFPNRTIEEPYYGIGFFWDEIILSALDKLDNETLLVALSDYISKKIDTCNALFNSYESEASLEKLLEHDQERKRIIKTIVSKFTNLDTPSHKFYRYQRSGLIALEDFDWIIGHIRNPKIKNEENIWAEILRRIFNIQSLDQIEKLLSIQDIPSIQNSFRHWLTPIKIDSEDAIRARQDYEEFGNPNIKETPSINLPQLISKSLHKIESGDTLEFIKLDNYLSLQDGETYYSKHYDFDILNYPGWLKASEELKNRIIDSAIDYLENIDVPEAIDFINSPIACTAFRSLVLIYNQDSSRVFSKLLEKWLHPIIYIELKNGRNTAPTLLPLCHQHFQQLTIEYIISLIKIEDSTEEKPQMSILNNIQPILDFELAKNLFFLWKNHSLKIVTNHKIKECLIKFDYPEILSLIKSNLDSSNSEEYVFDAFLIAVHFPQSFFNLFWTEFENQTELSHRIIAKIAWEERHSYTFLASLSENHLAQLYIWLETNYPHANDERASGIYTSTMQISDLRRYTLNNLVSRGTEEACNELLNIMSVFPEQAWIKYRHNEATEIYRRENWKPKSVEELLSLTNEMRKIIFKTDLTYNGIGINVKNLWKKYIY